MKIQIPKGTRDFYPEDMRLQNHIFKVWKEICLSFGYQEYESPTFEHLDLYTRKSGEEIISQLYHFEDKSQRKLALRPEMTPSLARMINQKGPSLKLPVRWFSMPRLYRYERAQRGRLREFYQLNMDIVGTASTWAEVDLISAIIEMLGKFGLEKGDFRVGISSRRILSAYLAERALDGEASQKVYAALDKWGKVSEEAFAAMLPPQLESPEEMVETFLKADPEQALEQLGSQLSTGNAVAEVKEVLDRLQHLGYGDTVAFDPSIVRGLAYYTGVVFEVFDAGKEFRAVAGGGRYDNLTESLGGRALSGVGFGIGDVVLHELLKKKNRMPQTEPRLDYYVAGFTGPSVELVKFVKKLREKDRRVTYGFGEAKLKKQLAEAAELGAAKVVFFGSEGVEPSHFEVKDLNTGEQVIVKFEDL